MTHFNKYNVVPNTSVSSAQLLLHSNFGIFSYSNQHFVNTRFFVYLIFQKKKQNSLFVCNRFSSVAKPFLSPFNVSL
jgi:hypothetical protein